MPVAEPGGPPLPEEPSSKSTMKRAMRERGTAPRKEKKMAP